MELYGSDSVSARATTAISGRHLAYTVARYSESFHAPVHRASSHRAVVFGRPVRCAAEGAVSGRRHQDAGRSLACSPSPGETNIELIQQHDEEPSVFRETLKARGAHGFHHWAIGARDFEKTVAHYRSRGYAEAFSDTAPMGFSRRLGFDTTRDLPGMREVIEIECSGGAGISRTMYQAASRSGTAKTHVVRQTRRYGATGMKARSGLSIVVDGGTHKQTVIHLG